MGLFKKQKWSVRKVICLQVAMSVFCFCKGFVTAAFPPFAIFSVQQAPIFFLLVGWLDLPAMVEEDDAKFQNDMAQRT